MNNKKEPIVLTIDNFLSNISDGVDSGLNFCFILGSGASVESKIPTGSMLAEEWFLELTERYNKESFEILIEKVKVNSNNAEELDEIYNIFIEYNKEMDEKKCKKILEKVNGKYYFPLYDLRFYPSYFNGTKEIEKIMEKGSPSLGYYLLSNILTKDFESKSKNNLVITTNFDYMIEEILYMNNGLKKPLVIDHESLTPFISNEINRPIIMKVHRGLFYNPQSRSKEMCSISQNWEMVLLDTFSKYTPIIIGYSGEDETLMSVLKNGNNKFEKGIFWCYRKNSEPNHKIKELISEKNGYLVEIDTFDKIMFQIATTLGVADMVETTENLKININDNINHIISKYNNFIGSSEFIKENKSIVNRKIKNLLFNINEKEEFNVYNQVGNLYFSIQKYDKATEFYEKAIKINPENYFAFINLGYIHSLDNDYEEAIKFYNEAIKINPKNDLAYMYIGNAYTNNKDFDKAIDFFEQAIKINPKNDLAYMRLGNNYANKKNFEKAIEFYNKAITINPENNIVKIDLRRALNLKNSKQIKVIN